MATSLEHPLKANAAIEVSPRGMIAVKPSLELNFEEQIEQLLQVVKLLIF
jgi:hypothetical protein